jgi:hypothetical protein
VKNIKNGLFAAFLMISSVLAFAQSQEELEAKTLRQIPANAKEFDISSIPDFSGNWISITNRQNSSEFKFSNSEKKVEWWIRTKKAGCGKRVYEVRQAFETSEARYLKLVAIKPSSPVCTPESWTLLLEMQKDSKNGFYSASMAEGTLKID